MRYLKLILIDALLHLQSLFDIEEALQMQKGINEYQFEVSHLLSI